MFTFQEGIFIRREPETVFAFLARAENIPLYASGIEKAEAEPAGELRSGSVAREYGLFRNSRKFTDWAVPLVEPSQKIVFETSNPFSKLGRVIFELAPVEGGTNLEVTVTFQARGLYRVLEPVIKRRLIKFRKIELARLKKHLEGEGG